MPDLYKRKIIYLDSDHHIQMTLRILFNDIPDIIGLSRLDITITFYLTHNNQWDDTCWNFLLATKYFIFLIPLIAFLCAVDRLEKCTSIETSLGNTFINILFHSKQFGKVFIAAKNTVKIT